MGNRTTIYDKTARTIRTIKKVKNYSEAHKTAVLWHAWLKR